MGYVYSVDFFNISSGDQIKIDIFSVQNNMQRLVQEKNVQ